MAKVGRKRTKLDFDRIEKLAGIGLTVAEIGAVEGVCSRTLERRAKDHIENGRLKMNSSLKRKQYEVAMQGNCSMLIWLGKNYLDQKDKAEVDQNINLSQASELTDEELASIATRGSGRTSKTKESQDKLH